MEENRKIYLSLHSFKLHQKSFECNSMSNKQFLFLSRFFFFFRSVIPCANENKKIRTIDFGFSSEIMKKERVVTTYLIAISFDFQRLFLQTNQKSTITSLQSLTSKIIQILERDGWQQENSGFVTQLVYFPFS